MSKKIVIFGSGRHSKVVFSEIVKIKKYKIMGFVDDFCKKGTKIISYKNKKYSCLGNISQYFNEIKRNNRKKNFAKIKNDIFGIVAVGLNFKRVEIVNKILRLNKNFKFESIVS